MSKQRTAVEQMRADLRTAAVRNNDINLVQQIDSLNETLDPRVLKEAAEIFSKHRYPDRVITWGRRAKYAECPALINLQNPSVVYLFDILAAHAGDSGLVQVSHPILEAITGWHKSTVKRAMRLLMDHGLIAIYRHAKGQTPPIYAINPLIESAGTNPRARLREYDNIIDATARDVFNQINGQRISKSVICKDMHDDGQVYKYARIELTDETEKEPADATTDSRVSDASEIDDILYS